MDSLHATIEEFAAEGFTHVQCYCRWGRSLVVAVALVRRQASAGAPFVILYTPQKFG
jgi:hypothetical protein